ncbi:uncharacterized protein HMPREF1541_00231 [Cyphellophora europaea CBS 101466]|uniref:BZIP domain-containing protein n=1 Tax=Cyphellophora europaea (strain CBS 101466) TaxID=1220924 RepID=W2SDD8_CYPE1|nr:uncharacterized protein HMPREF1541_00231 [Cyphellophora europaea CBS 101466]ETN46048.1 hypothetical protein HMPREF1541_00231 [Cyphellophora europaea CBS 101466]
MSQLGPPLGLDERIDLLDRIEIDMQFIDPEELHFSLPSEQDPSQRSLGSYSSGASHGSADFDSTIFSDLTNKTMLDSSISYTDTKPALDLDAPDADDGTTKGYTPHRTSKSKRRTTKSSSSSSSSLKVKPRNGQHARELARNRQAAANYRAKQKNQLDALLERAREEERRMVKQRAMVYSLKDELWHLRNELLARQQIQLCGASGSNSDDLGVAHTTQQQQQQQQPPPFEVGALSSFT